MMVRIVIGLTLREAARRKVLWGLLLLSVAFVALYALGLAFVHDNLSRLRGSRFFSLDEAYNFWLTAALYAANFLIVMMAVLISVDTLAGEIASGTIQAIAVKPLRRHDILIGKWLGFVSILGGYILLLVGGIVGITALITGYLLPGLISVAALMFLEALVLLSVSLLGGTRLSSLATGVLGFGLYGVAFVGGWMEQIGAFPGIQSDAAVTIGRMASLIMPGDAVWRYALSEIAIGRNPFSLLFGLTSAPGAGVVVYAAAFAGIVVLLAVASFQRRDL